MSNKIRMMNEADIEQVQAVAREAWHDTYRGIIPEEIQDSFLQSAYSTEMMKRRLQTSYLLVAEKEGQVVGFINTSQPNEQGEVELFAIYLLPNQQRQGIGRALLAESWKKTRNAKSVYVNVESGNAKGKDFYEKCGFKVIEEFDDDFDGHLLRTTRMVQNLHQSDSK